MKIITSKWATNMTSQNANSSIGFVLVENEKGVHKLYVGNGVGLDEKADEVNIAEWGTEISEGSPIYQLMYATARGFQGDKGMVVSCGYGANTKEPYVELENSHLDQPLRISPEDARGLGISLFEAADFAESEAFLMNFFKNMEMADEESAMILFSFRKYRDENRKPNTPSTPAEGL